MKPDIESREDVDPDGGLDKYGDVEFADPVNHKYPIDTPGHVRAAWSYINQSDNAAKYSAEDVEKIKDRIRKAAGQHGIDIQRSDDEGRS